MIKPFLRQGRSLLFRLRNRDYCGSWQGDEPGMEPVVSQLVTQGQTESGTYARWCAEFGETPAHHRKQWEYVYILQGLSQAGFMREGARGLGFGVGREPMPALLARYGCRVVATDMEMVSREAERWRSTHQLAVSREELNDRNLCEPERFRELVSFRNVDMNRIDPDLRSGGFDFVWSCCALEHAGSLEKSVRFIRESLQCLKPGGVAVHTTEYNVSSNTDTLEKGETVFFRKRDIQALVESLRNDGHGIDINLHPGTGPLDREFDVRPWKGDPHLKILSRRKYIVTSLGLLIRRAGP